MARQELHRRRPSRASAAALFLGAMVAARHNPTLKHFRDKLVAAGKPKLVAIIAVARKLLTILNAILRDQTPWPNKPLDQTRQSLFRPPLTRGPPSPARGEGCAPPFLSILRQLQSPSIGTPSLPTRQVPPRAKSPHAPSPPTRQVTRLPKPDCRLPNLHSPSSCPRLCAASAARRRLRHCVRAARRGSLAGWGHCDRMRATLEEP